MPSPEEMLSHGWQIHQAGNVSQAEQIYQQVLAAQPANANAWCYLGIALHDQQRYDEALAAYHRALALKPEFPIALNNLGNTYRLMRRVDQAVECFDKALLLKPDYLLAYKNKSTALCWEGRVEAALASYEAALRHAPGDPDVHKHIGILRLVLGDFAGGWPEYEWRWKTGEIKLPAALMPQWDGSPLDGKSILLTPEQGLGDTIQFVRYAAWLKQRYDCRVLFSPPKPLQSLLATCRGVDEWVTDVKSARADYFAPLIQVPGVLRQTAADFPADVPYLSADESLVSTWREKLAEYDGRKIGIAWRGSPTNQADVMRSIPLTEFAPLGRLKGVRFFSLQNGPAAEELNSLAGRLEVVDLGRTIDEGTGAFVESAAVLKNLDLLITCDTAIAHVAGALGVPVWLALAIVPDWRWLLAAETTPWYPTMRLFRQQAPGDWAGVMQRIAEALLKQFPDVENKQPSDYRVFTSGFNRLTRTRDGLVLYNRHDQYLGRSIDRYGEFSAGEVDLFRQVVRPGWTVVDAGANIGTHTLVFARQAGPRGIVYAFEPQPVLFQTLCANVALASLENVDCRCVALGEAAGTANVPPVNYNRAGNLGGVAIGSGAGEPVPLITIDGLALPQCHFLKIDVAGSELAVLNGARQTIERFRPILYVAADAADQAPPLIEHLLSLGYRLYWHTPPLFNPHNFYQNANNEFARSVSVNIIGIHSSITSDIHGLRQITGPHSDWRKRD
jgi:FkbM family methyltransferase